MFGFGKEALRAAPALAVTFALAKCMGGGHDHLSDGLNAGDMRGFALAEQRGSCDVRGKGPKGPVDVDRALLSREPLSPEYIDGFVLARDYKCKETLKALQSGMAATEGIIQGR